MTCFDDTTVLAMMRSGHAYTMYREQLRKAAKDRGMGVTSVTPFASVLDFLVNRICTEATP